MRILLELTDWGGDELGITSWQDEPGPVPNYVSIEINNDMNVELNREQVLDVINALAEWLEGEFTG